MRFVSRHGWLGTFSLGLVAALATFAFPAASGAAERPSWQALPDETVAVLRFPNLKEAYEALRTRTKLGAVAFDAKRVDAIKALILENSKDEVDELSAELVRLGLSFDDLLLSFEGEVGYGATAAKADDKPIYVGLLWAECGEVRAEKWIAALDKLLESQPEGVFKATREDIELAGVKVRRLRVPLAGPEGGKTMLGIGLNSKKGVLFDAKQAPDDKAPAEKPTVNSHMTILFGRSGGKLLAAHSIDVKVKSEDDDVNNDGLSGEKAEAENREHTTAVFARFLEAQAGGDEGYVQRTMQTPGLAEALPEGVPIVEFLLDVPALLKLADRRENEAGMKTARALGLGDFGPMAYRATLDGHTLRSGFFASTSAPRKGLAKLLEQAALAPKPADWVSTEVVGYQHWSIDFAAAYKLIADIVRNDSPKGEEQIAQLEEQAKTFLQTDVASLLGSLGTKHTILTFLPETNEAGAKGADETSQNAMAFVWRLNDVALWKRLMQTVALATGKEAADERGFTGLRHDQNGFSGGWFIGDGQMVLAIGKGVTEKTLSMLRTPPKADAALAGSPIAARAAELVPPQDSIMYDLTNGSTLLKVFTEAMAASMENETDPLAKKLKPIWPSKRELEGLIGVSVSTATVSEAGFTHRNVSDLPPP